MPDVDITTTPSQTENDVDLGTPQITETEAERKIRNRTEYENRKQRELEKVQSELAEYKRRDEERAKASLTELEREKVEKEQYKQELEKLRFETMRDKIANEHGIPDALKSRLIGSDEASLRADAETLSTLIKPVKAGTVTNPVRNQELTIDQLIEEATKSGDTNKAFILHRQKMNATK